MVLPSLILPFLVLHQATPAPRLRLLPGIGEEWLYTFSESRDGTRLATNAIVAGSRPSRAPRLWDAKRMKVLAVLGSPNDPTPVLSTKFSRDGRAVVTTTASGFQTFNAQTGRPLLVQKAPEGTTLTCVGLAPDASNVIGGTSDGRLLRWRVGEKEPLSRKIEGPLDGIGYLGDDAKIVIGLVPREGGEAVQSWRTDTLEPVQTYPVSKDAITWVDGPPDDSVISVTEAAGHVWVYDAKTAKPLFETECPNSSIASKLGFPGKDYPARVNAQFVGQDGNLLATPEKDGTIDLLDYHTGALKGKLIGLKSLVREMRNSDDGRAVVAVGLDDAVMLWDVASRKATRLPMPKSEMASSVEFSPDSRALWIGTSRGRLMMFDVATGGLVREERSATETIVDVQGFKNGNFSLSGTIVEDAGDKTYSIYQVFDPHDMSGILGYLPPTNAPPVFSPDGKRAIVFAPGDQKGGMPVNVAKYRLADRTTVYPDMISAVWETRGKWVACFFEGGKAQLLDGTTFKPVPLVQNGKTGYVTLLMGHGGTPRGSDVSPDGRLVATCGLLFPSADPKKPKAEYAILWDSKTGEFVRGLTSVDEKNPQCRFSPDGKRVAVKERNFIEVFDVKTTVRTAVVKGKKTTETTTDAKKVAAFKIIDRYSKPGKDLDEVIVDLRFTPDGKGLVAHAVDGALYLLDVATKGVELVRGDDNDRLSDNWTVSRDGRTGLNVTTHGIDVWDLPSKRIVARMPSADDVTSATFTPDERRVLAIDPVDGVVVWDFANRAAPRRLGGLVFGRGKELVTIDADGRYDATDPSKVTSASYVFAWSGGLEPVEVSQMKSRFWEPGLFAKLMGLDPEPRRAVPDVATLGLYPEVKLTPKKDNTVGVEVSDRDDGGVGSVEVILNGKLVQRKSGGGYFTFDPNAYRGYLIPASKLRPGERNELRVVAGNEQNDLRSPGETVALALPPDLQVPKSRLIALCVGAGKYLGGTGSLLAPPSDAKAIGAALDKVSKRLLPDGVDVTVLTTDSNDPEARPSRTRIMRWFADTAEKATSSDIVMVFMAGHGTNAIGEKKDYFFITPDVSPTDVGPASIGVGTVSGGDLREALSKIVAAKQIVILDTCHSGSATKSLLVSSRSLAGDYARAYENIREASGTWVLAGASSDQLSYESTNVDHGMLTYALLEAIDRASSEGLRKSESGELFVDVEGWLKYAVGRVESLKEELSLPGVQQPELRASIEGGTFDLGVTSPSHRGELGLRAPRPVVIVGGFSNENDEDPLRLEKAVGAALSDSKRVKPWFDVASHPGVYRVAGTYAIDAKGAVKLKFLLQRFDGSGDRKTIKSIVLMGTKANPAALVAKARTKVETILIPPDK